jgi:hypothetical protein
MLPSIRDAIYSIYGFVRFADEIGFLHGFNKEELINDFEKNIINLEAGISLN